MEEWVCSFCGAKADHHVNTGEKEDIFYCNMCWAEMMREGEKEGQQNVD